MRVINFFIANQNKAHGLSLGTLALQPLTTAAPWNATPARPPIGSGESTVVKLATSTNTIGSTASVSFWKGNSFIRDVQRYFYLIPLITILTASGQCKMISCLTQLTSCSVEGVGGGGSISIPDTGTPAVIISVVSPDSTTAAIVSMLCTRTQSVYKAANAASIQLDSCLSFHFAANSWCTVSKWWKYSTKTDNTISAEARSPCQALAQIWARACAAGLFKNHFVV